MSFRPAIPRANHASPRLTGSYQANLNALPRPQQTAALQRETSTMPRVLAQGPLGPSSHQGPGPTPIPLGCPYSSGTATMHGAKSQNQPRARDCFIARRLLHGPASAARQRPSCLSARPQTCSMPTWLWQTLWARFTRPNYAAATHSIHSITMARGKTSNRDVSWPRVMAVWVDAALPCSLPPRYTRTCDMSAVMRRRHCAHSSSRRCRPGDMLDVCSTRPLARNYHEMKASGADVGNPFYI